GSMGESSCCIADELVLVPPGSALARVGLARVRYTPGEALPGNVAHKLDEFASPGCRSLVGAPAPGANSVVRGLEVLLLHRGRAGARPSQAAPAYARSPGRRRLVGAPAPGANSVARRLARWAGSAAASRPSWCWSLPGLHRLGLA